MVLLLGISIFGIYFLVSYEMRVHTPENGPLSSLCHPLGSNFISSLSKGSSIDPLNWRAVSGKLFLIMAVAVCVLWPVWLVSWSCLRSHPAFWLLMPSEEY